MIKITEINTIVKHIIISGEIYIALSDLISYLNSDDGKQIELEECLITPFYLYENKRMELYQYEFCMTNEYNFEDYITKLTGKKNYEEIPREIIELRKICFSRVSEQNKINKYLKYIVDNQDIKSEVEQVFDNFDKANLYVTVY